MLVANRTQRTIHQKQSDFPEQKAFLIATEKERRGTGTNRLLDTYLIGRTFTRLPFIPDTACGSFTLSLARRHGHVGRAEDDATQGPYVWDVPNVFLLFGSA
jgi:hypothetical protein